jgi:hypothetical protein
MAGRNHDLARSLCCQTFQTRGHAKFWQKWKYSDRSNAYEPMLFQKVSGALHVNILQGSRLCADPITCGGTSLSVITKASLVSSFEVPADWTIHTYALPASCRTNRSKNAVAVQKMPEITIEATWRRWKECSRIKSSIKVTLLVRSPPGLISEEWTLSSCPNGLDESLLLSGLADRRSCVSRFLGRLITAPVVPMRT